MSILWLMLGFFVGYGGSFVIYVIFSIISSIVPRGSHAQPVYHGIISCPYCHTGFTKSQISLYCPKCGERIYEKKEPTIIGYKCEGCGVIRGTYNTNYCTRSGAHNPWYPVYDYDDDRYDFDDDDDDRYDYDDD